MDSKLPVLLFTAFANMYRTLPLYAESVMCSYFFIIYNLLNKEEKSYEESTQIHEEQIPLEEVKTNTEREE